MQVFHYCNLDKFENILKSKKLWLTSVQTMKDGTEVDHLYNVIFPEVKKAIISDTSPELLGSVNEVLRLLDSNSKLHIAAMPYCTCFSDYGDLLAQWRSYADDGTGVSIGFDINYFNIKKEPPHPNLEIRKAIGLAPVIYDYTLQSSILFDLFRQIISLENPSVDWITMLANMTRYSAIFKNRTFYTEQEKRIIYYFFEQHTSQYSEDFLTGPFDYEFNGINYFRFELSWFNSSNNHAIAKIILGPKCKKSSIEIVEMLDSYGIKIKNDQILQSESTYR